MVISSSNPPSNPVADFETFFRTFEESPNEFKYRKKISEMYAKSEHSLMVLFEDILNFDPPLANYLRNYPEEALMDAVDALKTLLRFEAGGSFNANEDYFVRIATQNNSNEVQLKKIRARHIDKLIYVKGIIIRASNVRPEIANAAFECQLCGNITFIPQNGLKIIEPEECSNPNCNNKRNFSIKTDQSKFVDYQLITLQEAPEELEAGNIPKTVLAILKNDIVSSATPGQRVKVMGIYKSTPQDGRKGAKSKIFNTHLGVNSIEGLRGDEDDGDITEEDIKEITTLAREPNIQKKIARSIATSILGRDRLKMASALSLFGGNRKEKKDGSTLRGDIHVLFIGDPGTGKSQILQNCSKIAYRSIYTSGKGASAAGLTAAVVKENDNVGMQLEAGALVLASGGCACIDEFDKMRVQDRSAIHEAMEQQSYHPSFELTFQNKHTVKIGKFVDSLFKKYPERMIHGKDCEILAMEGLDYQVHSTDFKDFMDIHVHRVSRHEAPDQFIKIRAGNGREIIITPEHPLFTIDKDCNIITKDAIDSEEGMFIPGVNELDYSPQFSKNSSQLNNPIKLETGAKKDNKTIMLPEVLNKELATFLGYFVSNGFAHWGSSAEVGLSDLNRRSISDMIQNIRNTFDIETIDGSKTRKKVQIISTTLYRYLDVNFPEIMKKSDKKRIPKQIFNMEKSGRIAFLKAAFDGDGDMEVGGDTLGYKTSSIELAYDYQDLLLTLGIHSKIHSEEHPFSKKEKHTFGKKKEHTRLIYKIYIRVESMHKFLKLIIPHLHTHKGVQEILANNRNSKQIHNMVPYSVANLIIKLYKMLGISYDGFFDGYIKHQQGISREILQNKLGIIKKKIRKIKSNLRKQKTIKQFRDMIELSRAKIAKIANVSLSTIEHAENGSYKVEKQTKILKKIAKEYRNHLREIKSLLQKINNISQFKWLRIKEKNKVANAGPLETKWVYDVTIEPTECFISHGLVLHNTVSIAKAGIVATLQSKTAIIAAANPKQGRWDDYVHPLENINLSPPIRSRFDLILKVIDSPDKDGDERIAKHILKNHMEGLEDMLSEEEDDSSESTKKKNEDDIIPIELFKKYIRYAKNNFQPKLTKKAAKRIQEFYVEMRNSNPDSNAVSIVARNLESLVRMSEAYAKMALKEQVTVDDVEAVLELEMQHLKDIGYDEETGTYDVDILQSGKSASARKKEKMFNMILDHIKKMQMETPGPLEFEDIAEPLIIEGLEESFIKEALEEWVQEGTLYRPKPGTYQMTQRPKKKKR